MHASIGRLSVRASFLAVLVALLGSAPGSASADTAVDMPQARGILDQCNAAVSDLQAAWNIADQANTQYWTVLRRGEAEVTKACEFSRAADWPTSLATTQYRLEKDLVLRMGSLSRLDSTTLPRTTADIRAVLTQEIGFMQHDVLLLAPLVPPLLVTPQAISEYKSGISLQVLGTYGVDYLVENWYHDPKIDPRCTVYLKSTTAIDLKHNAANITGWREGSDQAHGGPALVSVSGRPAGTIRYRVDQEYGRRGNWGFGDGPQYPAWPGNQNFAAMRYANDASLPVVGVTGPVPGVSPGPLTCGEINRTYYWRGVVDPFGDEWHTIAVGDDDSANTDLNHNAWQSDGKVYCFVVNPATPCISFVAHDAAAQFFTTPPKAYWVPHIAAQTTYFDGNVTLEVGAFDVAKCRYSLVRAGSPASWQDYTGPVDISTLTADVDYTLSCRIGPSGQIKTRTINRAHAVYPSDGETHPGHILWANNAERDHIIARCKDTLDTTPRRHLWRSTFNQVGTGAGGLPPLLDGYRIRWQDNHVEGIIAFRAFVDGVGVDTGLEAWLHDALLDNNLSLDPVGVELNHDNGTPCQEVNAFGYYTAQVPFGIAMAYDMLIATNRKPARSYGWTAVEDHKIRHMLAGFAHASMLYYTDAQFGGGWPTGNGGRDYGMWGTAWLVSAQIIAMVMPEFDSSVYGTSGAPSGSVPSPHLWCPYKDMAISWWNMCNSQDGAFTASGGVNASKTSGFFGMLQDHGASDPVFGDKAGYWDLMGTWYSVLANTRHNYDGHHYAHVDRGFLLSVTGALTCTNASEGNANRCFGMMANPHFPGIQTASVGKISDDDHFWAMGIMGLCFDWDSDNDGNGR